MEYCPGDRRKSKRKSENQIAEINNILSFAYIWLDKGIQNEFLKHPKMKWLDGFFLKLNG